MPFTPPPAWQMNAGTVWSLIVLLLAVVAALVYAGAFAGIVVIAAAIALAICAGPGQAAIGAVLLAAVAALLHGGG